MTLEDRVHALAFLGLTPRQTRFIALVALHSGYCLRRQYLTFAGLRYGKNVREFLDGLVDRRLATRRAYRRDRGYLYHLCARSIYRAIDQEDNRNRRHTSPALIARKLMVLDHVLRHPERDWYATEQDKVALFTERFGVPVGDLPQRVYTATDGLAGPTIRYFVQKLPLYLEGAPPVVHVMYLVADDTGRGFEQFLTDHARLLARLPAWTVDAIGAGAVHGLPACQQVFEAFVTGAVPSARTQRADLDWFFETRRLVDAGQLGNLSVADLNRFRDARATFGAPAIASLYARWLLHGDAVFADETAASSPRAAVHAGHLVTEQLAGQYAQFGELAGIV
jgi:hypothetical protein